MSETSVDNHFTRQYNPEDNSEHKFSSVYWTRKFITAFTRARQRFLSRVRKIRVKWVPCRHDIAHPQGEHRGLRIWRVTVRVLNRQLWTADKYFISSVEDWRGTVNSSLQRKLERCTLWRTLRSQRCSSHHMMDIDISRATNWITNGIQGDCCSNVIRDRCWNNVI
jgi:hypothetical protein